MIEPPIAPVSSTASASPQPALTAAVGDSALSVKTILIVDDNVIVAKALGNLVKGAGWEPIVFNSAAKALSHIEKKLASPVAAVVDIHLPDLNGLVLSQKLRDNLGPNPPIIVLSGDTSTETIRSLPHVGATYFFSKPVNGKHLVEKLRTLLDPATA